MNKIKEKYSKHWWVIAIVALMAFIMFVLLGSI
jgi:hypothetical protein